MSTMHTSPAPLVPDRIPSQESPLSPEWIHAITILLGHPLTSEINDDLYKLKALIGHQSPPSRHQTPF